jgi:type I restriction enzyme S subunit
MFSGGVLRLHPKIDRFYFFAFLKHPLFKTQLLARVPRGATIAHAKSLWLDCSVPFPNQRDSTRVVRYVSALTEAIFDKEAAIRARHSSILAAIDDELCQNSSGARFRYEYPTSAELAVTGRMDTSLYCEGFSRFKHKIGSYRHGATCLSQLGVISRRGPNLAVSVIGRSIYSDTPRSGWYELIRPVNIGEYGTLIKREWLGSRKSLPVVKPGDLILGCEGFEKGRTIVILSERDRCTTNFHGAVLSWPGAEVWQTVFVRCYLAYLRECGVVDWVGVGGSGGHMSPEYFDYLPFPRFPDDKQGEIARLYHNLGATVPEVVTLDDFVEWHRRRNVSLGIVELDFEAQELKRLLLEVQEQIIDGKTVPPTAQLTRN